MNWDAVGAIAELTGAIGVIASLLYLAGQVRSSNRASLVNAKLENTRLLDNYVDFLLHNPQLHDLWRKGHDDYSALAANEVRPFTNLTVKAFYFFSAAFFQRDHGLLPETAYAEQKAILHVWLSGKGVVHWWDEMGSNMFGEDFVAYVNAEIESLGTRNP